MTETNDYRVALDVYSGPMDLLLFLIRRDEVDIYDIPIAHITAQYIAYVELLRELDPEVASEFLVLAATLMEIKSRLLLPKPPPEEKSSSVADPRLELVQQLLEYKRFKDAARGLEAAGEERARRFARFPVLPAHAGDEKELDSLDIWDLFEAFQRLLKQIGKTGSPYSVTVDDTPVALHAEDIMDSIERAGGAQPFEAVFAGRTRAEMIGLFLALLELIRQHRVRVRQDRPFGSIVVDLLDRRPLDDVSEPQVQEGHEPSELGDEYAFSARSPVDVADEDAAANEDAGAEEVDAGGITEFDRDIDESDVGAVLRRKGNDETQ